MERLEHRLVAKNARADQAADAERVAPTRLDEEAMAHGIPEGPSEQALDVRGLPCSTRRAYVYAAAAALQPGESFVFINDHDPHHLHLLLCDAFGVAWSWEYEEAGPERYAVRVGRPGQG